jgi:glycosyltransferase involved in cell wall biosynthesis
MLGRRLNVAVGIVTLGRREILAKMIDILADQTRLPDRLVICSVTPDDVDLLSLERFPTSVLLVHAPKGASSQRNRILTAVKDADVIVYFDDDFFPDKSYLANLEIMFLAHLDVVAATGFVLADGAIGPGLSLEQGLEIVRNGMSLPADEQVADCYGTYGCNMAFRMAPIVNNRILFDENLPLYAWQEDIDFSRQIAPFGRIVKYDVLRGVHLGMKLGRTSGVRFGYSQIANPVYLVRKGTMSWRHAKRLMWRNVAANLLRSFRPEPWVDRRGRLKGNLLALIDLTLRRSSPHRILQLN